MADGDRPFGVRAHRETGDAEDGRLFLHATGIREHECRAAHHRNELQIPEGLHEVDSGMRFDARVDQILSSARMQRDVDRQLIRNAVQRAHQ